MRFSRLSGSILVLSLAQVLIACSDDAPPSGGSGGSVGGGDTGGQGGGAGSTSTGFGGDGGGMTCLTSSECNGGVCVAGKCCASAEQVCSSSCCQEGAVCLFDACVIPGDPCHTANDCAEGQYCETALGEAQPGMPGCLEPVPTEGRCLDLPPVCDTPGDPPGCVPACEYYPPVGQLSAIEEWSWGPTNATHRPSFTDVWSTPAVGRIFDGNCDGSVDELDSPSIVFVSGNSLNVNTGVGTCCQCTGAAVSACKKGVLRVLDGRTGAEIWSLDAASDTSSGFSGLSVALGDIDHDGQMDILAVTGEGYVVMIDGTGQVVRTSDQPIPGHTDATFGWGGGLSIADMDGDGFPEIAYASTVFSTTNNEIKLLFTGSSGKAGAIHQSLSTFADLDGAPDGHLELLAGRTAYRRDGSVLWDRSDITDGFPAVGNFDADPAPEVVIVAADTMSLLDGATGVNEVAPVPLPGNGFGGPPTIADFDGDGQPEIGVAQQNFYTVMKYNAGLDTLQALWSVANHDLSSSVTGSSVFDFEGDGRAEVLYNDECFLWVFDGQTGAVRFATSTTSFTATESSVVADVDGDGHAEIIMIANSADPSSAGWGCLNAANNPTVINGVPWTPGPEVGSSYRGIKIFGDSASSWVGTRTLWNQHTYHVTNICDDRDSACDAPNVYGSIPTVERTNWTVPWLNNFRQNVQDQGIFNAPDATLALSVDCTLPVSATVSVRNIGLSTLPAGVQVGVFLVGGIDPLAIGTTERALFPGQTEVLTVTLPPSAMTTDSFIARILLDPQAPKFHECREDNNESAQAQPSCIQ